MRTWLGLAILLGAGCPSAVVDPIDAGALDARDAATDGGRADADGGPAEAGAGDAGAAACPTIDAGTPAAVDGGFAEFCDRYAEAACAAFTRCGMSAIAAPTCAEHFRGECARDTTAPVRYGAKDFDDEGAVRCLADLAALRCDDVRAVGQGPLCRPVKQYSSGVGEPCLEPFDCLHAYCPLLDPAAPTCRACLPLERGIGAPCARWTDCPRDLHCDTSRGVCAAPAALGEPCGAVPCGPDGYCAEDLRCRPWRATTATCSDTVRCGPDGACRGGVCVARGGRGAHCEAPEDCLDSVCRRDPAAPTGTCGAACVDEPCRGDADCERSAFCRGVRTSTDGAVLRLGRCHPTLASGDPCDLEEERPNRGCPLRTQCRGGRCTPTPLGTLPLGASCEPFPYDACADGAVCAKGPDRWSLGECRPGQAEDETCSFVAPCGPGLVCVGASCRRPAGPGEPCGSAWQCSGFLACLPSPAGAVCTHTATAADPACTSDLDCFGGTHCELPARTCASGRPAGEPCTNDQACASGRCAFAPGDPSVGACEPTCGP